MSIQDEITTRQYYDETGNVKYNQVLLPKHLVPELLESLHGKANRHPGIVKVLQEVRSKHFYPGIAKLVRKWVIGCPTCIKDKRISNNLITPELLTLPEWTLFPEDALQIALFTKPPTEQRIRKHYYSYRRFLALPFRLPSHRCFRDKYG